MKTIGILAFDEVEELDFVGPLEVFGMAARFGADCETLVIAHQPEYVRCRHGLQVVPDWLSATTHHSSLDLLREYGQITIQEGTRFVMHERVATSAGVTAGIDLALALVAREWGLLSQKAWPQT